MSISPLMGDVTAHRPLRILVVEDCPDTAETFTILLRMDGYQVRAASTGEAGLQAARAEPPDVVLLDIGLPLMDGYEVARHLREQAEGKPPFLVALTGNGQDEDRLRSREAGFDLHLLKPVNVERLRQVLSRFRDLTYSTN